MTFGQLLSNEEQMEAHQLAFEKDWNDLFLEALLDTFPEYYGNDDKIAECKFNCFVHYLERFYDELE